jgi:DGQHR domain-containing protein
MSSKFAALENLAVTDAEKNKEFLLRKFDFHEERIKPNYLAAKQEDGWQLVKTLKSVLVLNMPKKEDAALEDRVWRCLYQLGYDELNTGRNFYIPPRGSSIDPRQVDVFAKDDETVVIVECKTQAKLGGKNLSMFINDLAQRRQTMMDCIREHYNNKDLKVITLLVTEGILWGEHDEQLAKTTQVHKVTERELKYYTEIARNLGHAAKYQFNAEFLKDQRIKGLQLSYPAICQRIGGKKAYIFTAPASKLIKLAFVNHRELKDPESAPSYQRMLKKARLGQVSNFINNGGYFANSILISVSESSKDGCRFEPKEKADDNGIAYGILKLPQFYKSLRVIDGQHRLYGAAESLRKDSPVVVVALVDIKEDEEARLFKEINKEQKGVDASLLSSLEGALGKNSTDASEQLRSTAARITEFLLEDAQYPFHSNGQGLTISSIANALLLSGLIGTVRKDGVSISGVLSGATPDETMGKALKFFKWYFSKIKNTNLKLWNDDFGKRTFGAPSTNVFVAGHISFIAAVTKAYVHEGEVSRDLELKINPFLDAYCDQLSTMSTDDYRNAYMSVNYGGASQEEFKFKIAINVSERCPDFSISGLAEKKHATDRSRIDISTNLAKKIAEISVQLTRMKVADKFADSFWTAEAGFLTIAFVNELMKRKHAQKAAAGSGFENYLAFGDISKHLAKKDMIWAVLKADFNIKTRGSSPGAKKHVNWMNVVERLSNSNTIGILSDEDEETVRAVYKQLTSSSDYALLREHNAFQELTAA